MKEIALHMMDIVQNSIRAGASVIETGISVDTLDNIMVMTVSDNGKGMDPAEAEKAADPWFTTRTTRKIGMGLPLLKMNSELSGGSFSITSSPGKGTAVKAAFGYDHFDRPPLGDLPGVISLLIHANPLIDIVFSYTFDNSSWSISTGEIREVLGDEAVTDLGMLRHIKELISENLSDLTNIKQVYDKN